MNQAINPEGWVIGKTATGLNHLNWGIKSGQHVYVAGMLSTDPADGSLVGVGDIEVQTRRVLDSIKVVLEAAGSGMQDVTFNQIFLKTMDDYHAFNEIYVTYFPDLLPARFCLKADMVREEFLVEIAATAVIPA
ncbi:Putative aminoacrylate peracid reductase RutC (plasmid) [Paracoccaceae bacterium]|nr:Putative aminoacrylate peracid reductase RutC [Paracoccaceae bacterium]